MSVHNLHYEQPTTGDVYIGRSSIPGGSFFGNPFVIGRDGDRETVIDKFREYAKDRLYHDPEFRAAVRSLYGKRLFCYCHPKPCHGDVLEILARREFLAEQRAQNDPANWWPLELRQYVHQCLRDLAALYTAGQGRSSLARFLAAQVKGDYGIDRETLNRMPVW